MSSTNRGYERHKTDFYVTPPSAVRDAVRAFLADECIEDHDKLVWLDPCAGGDKNHQMMYPHVLATEFNTTVRTIDIREDSQASVKGDYLKTKLDYVPDIIITNPPFYLAKEIIMKAIEDVDDGGYIIMLLRLNFFGSKGRQPFFKKYLPLRTYVHHARLSFTDDKKTDSIEYMTCVWRKGYNPRHVMLSIL